MDNTVQDTICSFRKISSGTQL